MRPFVPTRLWRRSSWRLRQRASSGGRRPRIGGFHAHRRVHFGALPRSVKAWQRNAAQRGGSSCCKRRPVPGGHLPDLRGRGPSFTDLTLSDEKLTLGIILGSQGSPTLGLLISAGRAFVVHTGGLSAWSTRRRCTSDPRRGGYLAGGAGYSRNFPGLARTHPTRRADAVGWCFGAERAGSKADSGRDCGGIGSSLAVETGCGESGRQISSPLGALCRWRVVR